MFDVRSVLLPGTKAVAEKVLDATDTSAYYGSGRLSHLVATPSFVALVIKAAVNAVEDRLPEGFVTVGRSMEFVHDAPTCLGMSLRVKATLKEIDGERLLFDIVACDNYGEVGYGTHERVVVSLEKLLDRAGQRCSP